MRGTSGVQKEARMSTGKVRMKRNWGKTRLIERHSVSFIYKHGSECKLKGLLFY